MVFLPYSLLNLNFLFFTMATTTATKEAVRAALAPIAADMAEVERVIAEEMSSSVARVQEIGRYITQAGGKRMRPALLILMARAMGEKDKGGTLSRCCD